MEKTEIKRLKKRKIENFKFVSGIMEDLKDKLTEILDQKRKESEKLKNIEKSPQQKKSEFVYLSILNQIQNFFDLHSFLFEMNEITDTKITEVSERVTKLIRKINKIHTSEDITKLNPEMRVLALNHEFKQAENPSETHQKIHKIKRSSKIGYEEHTLSKLSDYNKSLHEKITRKTGRYTGWEGRTPTREVNTRKRQKYMDRASRKDYIFMRTFSEESEECIASEQDEFYKEVVDMDRQLIQEKTTEFAFQEEESTSTMNQILLDGTQRITDLDQKWRENESNQTRPEDDFVIKETKDVNSQYINKVPENTSDQEDSTSQSVPSLVNNVIDAFKSYKDQFHKKTRQMKKNFAESNLEEFTKYIRNKKEVMDDIISNLTNLLSCEEKVQKNMDFTIRSMNKQFQTGNFLKELDKVNNNFIENNQLKRVQIPELSLSKRPDTGFSFEIKTRNFEPETWVQKLTPRKEFWGYVIGAGMIGAAIALAWNSGDGLGFMFSKELFSFGLKVIKETWKLDNEGSFTFANLLKGCIDHANTRKTSLQAIGDKVVDELVQKKKGKSDNIHKISKFALACLFEENGPEEALRHLQAEDKKEDLNLTSEKKQKKKLRKKAKKHYDSNKQNQEDLEKLNTEIFEENEDFIQNKLVDNQYVLKDILSYSLFNFYQKDPKSFLDKDPSEDGFLKVILKDFPSIQNCQGQINRIKENLDVSKIDFNKQSDFATDQFEKSLKSVEKIFKKKKKISGLETFMNHLEQKSNEIIKSKQSKKKREETKAPQKKKNQKTLNKIHERLAQSKIPELLYDQDSKQLQKVKTDLCQEIKDNQFFGIDDFELEAFYEDEICCFFDSLSSPSSDLVKIFDNCIFYFLSQVKESLIFKNLQEMYKQLYREVDNWI